MASALDVKRTREHAINAPLLLGFVVSPHDRNTVPMREQWLSAGAAVGNLLHAAHALGFGAMVRSGERCFDTQLGNPLGIRGREYLAGFVSVGTIKEAPQPHKERLPHAVWSVWQGQGLNQSGATTDAAQFRDPYDV